MVEVGCCFLIIPTDSRSTVIPTGALFLGRGIKNLSLYLSKQRYISLRRVEVES